MGKATFRPLAICSLRPMITRACLWFRERISTARLERIPERIRSMKTAIIFPERSVPCAYKIYARTSNLLVDEISFRQVVGGELRYPPERKSGIGDDTILEKSDVYKHYQGDEIFET